ncbi:MAG: 2-hydroxychromene-2-carboxylate isomerase [Oceanospirillaceae bacterium]|nr:2-hydroxychromene-2-carboxylate isomerase [Oceanospirillaceae bacterium]
MRPRIDYYFDSLSPFTYLGHARLLQIAADASAEICYLPVKLGPVFAASGAKPLAERPQPRRDYRLLELDRWSKKRGRPLNLQPRYFPVDTDLANRCIIALQADGRDPAQFVDRILAACWSEEQNIADPALIRDRLEACGFDADQVCTRAASDEIRARYDQNTDQAVASGILGAPAYVLDGEQFWGQDRLELLEDKLSEYRTA